MINEFLELGFEKIGQFKLRNRNLDFERINVDYNPANILYAVLTETQTLYIGETKDEMNIVLKDLIDGNRNRSTRNRIHLLIKEAVDNAEIHFMVAKSSVNSKKYLIKKFQPIGNKNGKQRK